MGLTQLVLSLTDAVTLEVSSLPQISQYAMKIVMFRSSVSERKWHLMIKVLTEMLVKKIIKKSESKENEKPYD